MPIRNYPFSVIRPGDLARPYLPVTIINPDSQKQIKVYALIDTGADECAFPASFAPILGHDFQAGYLSRIPCISRCLSDQIDRIDEMDQMDRILSCFVRSVNAMNEFTLQPIYAQNGKSTNKTCPPPFYEE